MSQMEMVKAKVDCITKATAETVLESLGFQPAEAIQLFYRQIVERNGLPFDIERPMNQPAVVESYPEIFATNITSVQEETWGPPGRGTEMLQLLLAYRKKAVMKKSRTSKKSLAG